MDPEFIVLKLKTFIRYLTLKSQDFHKFFAQKVEVDSHDSLPRRYMTGLDTGNPRPLTF